MVACLGRKATRARRQSTWATAQEGESEGPELGEEDAEELEEKWGEVVACFEGSINSNDHAVLSAAFMQSRREPSP